MNEFKEPVCDVIRFGNDVIVTSISCNCDLGDGPEGDDTYCTGGVGPDGDVECVITDAQGNC